MHNHTLGREISLGFLLRFTLPTIIMMVFTSLYTIVDGIFVSQLINTDALSAVNIVFPLLSIVIAMGTMFGTGVAAIMGKKLGEGRRQESSENFSFVVLFSLLLSVVLAILVYIFLTPILYTLGANEDIFHYCRDYAYPLIFFLPASMLQLIFQYAMVTDGRPGLGLCVSILGGAANMALDYLFIGVFEWGIAGAAIATGIGYCIPALFGVVYFFINKKGLVFFTRPKSDWRMLQKSMTNGSSEMVSNLSMSVTTFLFNITMMHFLGQDGVAAITIVQYLDFLLVAVNLGYSMGVAPLISFNYGSKNNAKLRRIFQVSLWLTIGFAIVVTIGSMVFARPLVATFAQKGTAVFEFAASGMVIYAISYLFKGFNIFSSALFTAFSNGKVSAILSFTRTLLFLVLCILGLSVLFGVSGIWFAVPVAEVLALILSLIYVRKYRGVYHYA